VKEKAVIVQVTGEDALVKTVPDEKCSGCCSCSASRSRVFTVPVNAADLVREGDIVEITVDTSAMIRTYVFIYAIPLAVFLAVLIGAYALTASPLWSSLAACAGLLAAYAAIGSFVRRKPGILPDACARKRFQREM
jgi:positive regulator of sigma E activity